MMHRTSCLVGTVAESSGTTAAKAMENSKSRRCDDDNDDERITATAKTVDVNHNHPSTTTTSSSSSSSYRPNLSEFVSYVTTCGFQDTTTTTTSSACGGLNTTTTTTTTPTNRSSSSCSSKSRAVSTILKGTTLSPEMRARSTDEPLAVAEDRNQQNWNDNGDIEENRLPKNEPHGQPYHHHHHHRAVSDPVYSSRHQQLQDVIVTVVTEEEEDEDDDALFFDAETAPTNTESTFIIPPLPRYPVADTRDNKKNCWSEPPVSIFTVRGVNYFTDHKKQPCDNYVLQARGSHIFLTDSKTTVNLDQMTHTILGGQLRKKPTLAINFRFPWGYMNLYFELPQKLAVFMVHPADNKYKSKSNNAAASSIDADTSLSIAEKTVAKWLLGDDDYKNQRLKLIPYIAEGPWVVRNMVTGRPAIIGKKLPVSYHLLSSNTGANCSSSSSEQPLLTATLDIGNSSATANRIVSVCRRYMSALTVDIGFVIQSESPQELPEQMLGAIRVHGPDPSKAPKLY